MMMTKTKKIVICEHFPTRRGHIIYMYTCSEYEHACQNLITKKMEDVGRCSQNKKIIFPDLIVDVCFVDVTTTVVLCCCISQQVQQQQ